MARLEISVNALSPDAARQRPLTSLRKDRRLNRRVPVSIRGRFLADDNEDHRLLTLNMSCGGARLRANRRPPVGTPLVCYFDDLGRIEAEVVRHTEDGFAVRFRVTQRKRDKIADRLTWLANYKQLGLSDERAEPRHAAGGPAIAVKGKIDKKVEYKYDFSSTRRSIYVPVFRNKLMDIFEVFDFGNPNISSGRRIVTTRPTQALFLLNSPFMIERSIKSANLLIALEGLDDARRIEQAYLRILSRPPGKKEMSLALDYLRSHPYRQLKKEPEIAAGRLEAWASLCQALLSCNDFRYLN